MPAELSMKYCPACGETKPGTLEFFHRNASLADGLCAKCKPCLNAEKRERWSRKHPPNPPSDTKVCKRCGTEKPATHEYFHKSPNCRGGLNTICRVCRIAQAAAARATDRETNPRQPRAVKPIRTSGLPSTGIPGEGLGDISNADRAAALARVLAFNADRRSTRAAQHPSPLPAVSRYFTPVHLETLYSSHNNDTDAHRALLIALTDAGLQPVAAHIPNFRGEELTEIVIRPYDRPAAIALNARATQAAATAGYRAMPIDRACDKVAQGYIARFAVGNYDYA